MRSGPGSNEAKVMGSERSAQGDVVKLTTRHSIALQREELQFHTPEH